MAKRKKQVQQEELETFEDLKKALGGTDIVSAKEFLSTGSTLLDYAISNRSDGGVPVGRISEIFGGEGSGKSLIAYHIMAETQRRGGVAVYIDVERSADEEFMKRMGVDTKNNFIYPAPPKSIEDVFELIENTIKVIRSRYPNKEKLFTIVWDSVAATQARSTVELAYGESSITPEARAMSQCFRKAIDALELGYVTLVCINQIRKKIGISFGDDDTTPHGRALPFYATTRIKLKSLGKVKEGSSKSSRIIGVNCKAVVIKNKVAPGHRDAEFPLMFDWGIDDVASWLDYLKDSGIIKTSGAWSTFKLGELDHKFQGLVGWREVAEKEGVKEAIFNHMKDNLVIEFKAPPKDLDIENKDLILEGSGEDE